MTLWFTSFIVSGAGLIIFLLLKTVQDKYKILLFWPEARERIEKNLITRKERAERYLKQQGALSLKKMHQGSSHMVTAAKASLNKRLDKISLVRQVKGTKDIEPKGKSSYFLNDIASWRNKFRR
jgi:hypothetical protein